MWTLKGIGKVYEEVVVDTLCSLAFAKAYTSKMPNTAADLLIDRALPFYPNASALQVDRLGIPRPPKSNAASTSSSTTTAIGVTTRASA